MVYHESREEYCQASFQRNYDEGNTADHTHYFAKVVRAGSVGGRAFTAAYSVLSLLGFINILHLTMTKGMNELENLIQDYSEVRKLVGAPELKIFSSDNLSGDGSLWRRKFNELEKDTVPYRAPSYNCPRLGIDLENVEYIDSIDRMNDIANALIDKYSSWEGKVVYGFDAEWNWGESGARLLIVSMPTSKSLDGAVAEKVKLFDLNAAGIFGPDNFPVYFKKFLELKVFVPTGVNVGGDCGRMRLFGVRMEQWYELKGIAEQLKPSMAHYGLANLAEEFMRGSMDKHGQRGDYSQIPLPDHLQRYAAIDGRVSLRLFEILSSRLKSCQTEPMLEPPKDLNEGQIADLHASGERAARVRVTYIGGVDSRETKKWGTKTVKNGTATVQLLEVYVQSISPPFSFKAHANDLNDISWKRNEKTLQDLFLAKKEILVHTSSLVISVTEESESADAFDDQNDILSFEGAKAANCNTGAGNNESQHFDGEDNNCTGNSDGEDNNCTGNSDGEDNNCTRDSDHPGDIDDPFLNEEVYFIGEEDGTPRCRQKEDIFHQFQNLPIGKSEPLYFLVSRLLILATFLFDADDFEKIESHVQKGLGVSKDLDRDKYDAALLNHFYHNREWWRQRCRMYTPKACDHAQRINALRDLMKSDESLKKLYTDDVATYFDRFVAAILRGEFEELGDVQHFKRVGTDSLGLLLYIRLRGTVRNENVHQKMKTAIGPWKIGAKTAHMLLVLLSYRYNVNTSKKRNGGYDFGHYELHYIDRIQKRIQEIYNVLLWPRHKNVLDFKGKKGFVSVGIGPLCYDERFVQLSDKPAQCLKGDLYFISKQMGLKYPLQHLGKSRGELTMYNEFMLANKPTGANFVRLAEQFKLQSNGITIFPKLPSMLKSYYKNWKRNHEIKTSEMALDGSAASLLQKFFTPVSNSATFHQAAMNAREEVAQMDVDADEDFDNLQHLDFNTVGNDVLSDDNKDEDEQDEIQDHDIPSSAQIFVPSLQATSQHAYIPGTIRPFKIQESRRCVAFPYCEKQASECGGWTDMMRCKFTKTALSRDPSLKAQIESDKKHLQKQEKNERKRNKRRRRSLP